MKTKSFYTTINYILVFVFIATIQSCSINESITTDEITTDDTILNEDDATEETEFTSEGEVEIINKEKIDDNYILVNDASTNRVYLMNKEGHLLHEWPLTKNIGNDVFLLENGKLLASLEVETPLITLGGQGGQLQFVAPDGTIEWNFIHSSLEGETHHDAELLPNGNVIAMVWSKRSSESAIQDGYNLPSDIYVESIIEINPTTNEIVWEWDSTDHLIQDIDDTKSNYGIIADHPEKIDINYSEEEILEVSETGIDVMHANGIAYDEENDVIFLSVNFYSEVWVIDHSTTAAEAATDNGGKYGKGGDLIYRFGNPETYQNNLGSRLFHNNHFPNLLKESDQGKLLIFSNGNDILQSTVYELTLPDTYELNKNTDNEPKITWSFTDPELYSGRVSGAVSLPNGNVLITEGDFGFWEVTRDLEVVWKFSSDGFYWRGYHYSKTDPEILSLDL